MLEPPDSRCMDSLIYHLKYPLKRMNIIIDQDWYVYILECRDKTLYTGVTNNPRRRFEEHDAGKGAKYTRGRYPVKMKYLVKIGDKREAFQKEVALKKMRRAHKFRLIEENRENSEQVWGEQFMWWCLLFEKAKTHTVPDVLKSNIIENMKDRGRDLCVVEENERGHHKIKEGGICLGGARLMDESRMTFYLPGLRLTLFASDVEHYIDQVTYAHERLELTSPYYKLHGYLHCLCLLPFMRRELEEQLRTRADEAKALAAIDAKRWNAAMEKLKDCPHVDLKKR